MANHELLKLTAHQVTEGKYDKAILAIGSCEAHTFLILTTTRTSMNQNLPDG